MDMDDGNSSDESIFSIDNDDLQMQIAARKLEMNLYKELKNNEVSSDDWPNQDISVEQVNEPFTYRIVDPFDPTATLPSKYNEPQEQSTEANDPFTYRIVDPFDPAATLPSDYEGPGQSAQPGQPDEAKYRALLENNSMQALGNMFDVPEKDIEQADIEGTSINHQAVSDEPDAHAKWNGKRKAFNKSEYSYQGSYAPKRRPTIDLDFDLAEDLTTYNRYRYAGLGMYSNGESERDMPYVHVENLTYECESPQNVPHDNGDPDSSAIVDNSLDGYPGMPSDDVLAVQLAEPGSSTTYSMERFTHYVIGGMYPLLYELMCQRGQFVQSRTNWPTLDWAKKLEILMSLDVLEKRLYPILTRLEEPICSVMANRLHLEMDMIHAQFLNILEEIHVDDDVE